MQDYVQRTLQHAYGWIWYRYDHKLCCYLMNLQSHIVLMVRELYSKLTNQVHAYNKKDSTPQARPLSWGQITRKKWFQPSIALKGANILALWQIYTEKSQKNYVHFQKSWTKNEVFFSCSRHGTFSPRWKKVTWKKWIFIIWRPSLFLIMFWKFS